LAIVIAAERSGSGKTTVTLALLAALRARSIAVGSFKVGPDYIDPMFHAFVTGRSCYNLDPVLTEPEYLSACFNSHTADLNYAVVEGVMGLFDGAFSPSGYGSTAAVAKSLHLPVVLTIDCRSLSQSVAAIVSGYRHLDRDLDLAGVILNRVGSDRHREILEEAIEPLGVPILGVFYRHDEISIPDRYLGLIPTEEITEITAIVERLAVLGEANFVWEKILPLIEINRRSTKNTIETYLAPYRKKIDDLPVQIAVAKDAAFNFYYADNLEILQSLGAEIIYWSPLAEASPPEGINALYFGGGFPEIFAEKLAANRSAIAAIRELILQGTPTYGECGGLMYLCREIVDFAGCRHPLTGILPTTAKMGDRLTLGYRSAQTSHDTPLLPASVKVRGHEFHRSTLTQLPASPLFRQRRRVYPDLDAFIPDLDDAIEGWHLPHLHASYLHLHWGATPQYPARWIAKSRYTQPRKA
jgi:cobyrinic acid a,c-diamide synthase